MSDKNKITSASYAGTNFELNEVIIYSTSSFIKKGTISSFSYVEGKITANLKTEGNSAEDTVLISKIHKDVDIIKFDIYQYDSLTLGMKLSLKSDFKGESKDYTICGFDPIINNGSVKANWEGGTDPVYIPYDLIDVDTTLVLNNAEKENRKGIIKIQERGKDTKYSLNDYVSFVDTNGNVVSGSIKSFDVKQDDTVVAYIKTTTADKKLDLATIAPYPEGGEFCITGCNGVAIGTEVNYTDPKGEVDIFTISAYEYHNDMIFAIGNKSGFGSIYVPCNLIKGL